MMPVAGPFYALEPAGGPMAAEEPALSQTPRPEVRGATIQRCPNCEARADVSAYVAGQLLRCHRCNVRFEVRRADAAEARRTPPLRAPAVPRPPPVEPDHVWMRSPPAAPSAATRAAPAPPLRPRGGRHGAARSPGHRTVAGPRPDRSALLDRHGPDRRHLAAQSRLSAEAVPARPGAAVRARRARARLRPRARGRAPRSEAGQRARDLRWPDQGARLRAGRPRPREGRGGRVPDPEQRGDGHRQLHGAGAAARRQTRRPPRRPLLVRRDAVRDR